MNDSLDKIKKYINAVTYNVKKVLPLKLDKIIEGEFENTFEILNKYIEYIKKEYGIDYKIPRLEILENSPLFYAHYSKFKNEIMLAKKSIKNLIDKQLKFLNNKEETKRLIYERLKSLGYKEIKDKDIEYLNIKHSLISLLYPFYTNEINIRKSITKYIIIFILLHEIWHSIDDSILDKLDKGSTIKDIDYSTISNNLELRASAFGAAMYFLVNGFHKDERGYRAAYANILTCRKYVEETTILENNEYKNVGDPYDLGFCYGNIIVAKYGSSLKKNIHKIIDDIIHLNEERVIDEIKLYGDNLEWILQN